MQSLSWNSDPQRFDKWQLITWEDINGIQSGTQMEHCVLRACAIWVHLQVLRLSSIISPEHTFFWDLEIVEFLIVIMKQQFSVFLPDPFFCKESIFCALNNSPVIQCFNAQNISITVCAMFSHGLSYTGKMVAWKVVGARTYLTCWANWFLTRCRNYALLLQIITRMLLSHELIFIQTCFRIHICRLYISKM